jgi:hypothetical protein
MIDPEVDAKIKELQRSVKALQELIVGGTFGAVLYESTSKTSAPLWDNPIAWAYETSICVAFAAGAGWLAAKLLGYRYSPQSN